jgi:hypothetical protein
MPLSKAKHPSVCYRCGLPILVGQMIDWTRNYASRDRHAGCQTEAERAVAPYDPKEMRYVSPKKEAK